MLRRVLLAASASKRVRQIIMAAPFTRDVVARFVAGDTADDVLRVTQRLQADGLLVTIDYLGEDTTDPDQAAAVTDEYVRLLGRLGAAGLAGDGRAEVSVKPTAVGLDLRRAWREDRDGEHHQDLRGCQGGGHHGHGRHGGPHEGRRDVAPCGPAPPRVPRSRLCDPVVPAAQPG